MVDVYGNNTVSKVVDDQVDVFQFFWVYLDLLTKIGVFGVFLYPLSLLAGVVGLFELFGFILWLFAISTASDAGQVRPRYAGYSFTARSYRGLQNLQSRARRPAVIPQVQSGFEAQDTTYVATVAFLYCMVSELCHDSKPDRFIAECVMFCSKLASDPILGKTDCVRYCNDIISSLQDTVRYPRAQSFAGVTKTKFFAQVITLFAMVMGFLMADGSRFSFDVESFKASDFTKAFSVPKSPLDCFNLVMDVLSSLADRWDFFRETGSVKSFFMDDFDNRTLQLEISEMLGKEELLRSSSFKLAGFGSSFEALLALDNLITKCRVAISEGRSNTTIVAGKLKLDLIRNTVMARSHGNSLREQPFGVLIYGKSGKLKSVLSDLLVRQLLVRLGLPSSAEYVGRLNLEEEFQSTYEPHYTAVTLDDLANTRADKTSVVLTQKIIDLINNAPSCTNQADLSRKGMIWYRPAVVVATTNVKDLQAGSYSNQPDSVLRRFVHIHVDDVIMAQDPRDIFSNQFKGRVIVYESRGDAGNFKPSTDLEFDDTPTLMAYMSQKVRNHAVLQGGLVQGSKDLYAADPCEHNSLRPFCGICNSPQAQSGIIHTGSGSRWDSVGLYYLHVALAFLEVIPKWDALNRLGLLANAIVVKVYYGTLCYFSSVWFPYLSGWSLFAAIAPLGVYFRPLLSFVTDRVLAHMYARASRMTFRVRDKKIFFIGSLTIMAFGMMVKGIFFRDKSQNGVPDCQSNGSIPEVWQDETNIWKRDYVTPHTIRVPRELQGLPVDTTKNSVRANVVKVSFQSSTSTRQTNYATYVGDGYWMLNKHFLDGAPSGVPMSFHQPWGGKFGLHTFAYTRDLVQEIPGSDVCLIKPNVRRMADIKRLLPETLEAFRSPGVAKLTSSILYPEKETTAYSGTYIGTQTFGTDSGSISSDFVVASVTKSPTSPGDCGLPYLCDVSAVQGRGCFLMGFHMGACGTTPQVYSVVLTLKQFTTAVKTYEGKHIGVFAQSGDAPFEYYDLDSGEAVPVEVSAPHHKSSAAHSGGGTTVEYLGKLVGAPLAKPKSHVTPSYISASYAAVSGVQREHGPPGGGSPMAQPKHYQAQFDGVANIAPGFPTALLDKAAGCYLERVSTDANVLNNLYRIYPMTIQETINGIPGRHGVDRMVMNTSAGYPHGGAKRRFFRDVGNDTLLPKDGLQKAIDSMEEVYAAGKSARPIFMCNLKDEPTRLDKEKVRVFAGAPLVFSILVRKYLLGLASVMSLPACREAFECAVGTNCFGAEWGKMRNYLVQHGQENIVAGDYKAFDQNMRASVTERALGIMYKIVRTCTRYGERDLVIVRGILTDLMYPTYLSQGELYTVAGSNPSGNNLTVMINCVVNSLYVRCVYYAAQPPETPLSFNDTVSLMTYGDDNIMGVSSEVTEWFNHTTLMVELRKVGIVFTMPDKTAESIPLVEISSADFLKREFVERTVRVTTVGADSQSRTFDARVVLCPLTVTSISKMLHCYRGGALSLRDAAVVNIDGALREAVHHGPEYYSQLRSHLQIVVEQEDLLELGELPTFDETFKSWYEANWYAGSDRVVSVQLVDA